MNCDLVRPIVASREERDWPRDVSEHLDECDACLNVVIERALERPPSATPPADFAARLTSLATRSRPAPSRWPGAASVMLAVLVGCATAVILGHEGGLGGSERPAPAMSWSLAILLAGAAEAAVVIALTAQSNVIRVTGRR